MSSKEKYVLTGRYMNGTEVTAYHTVSHLNGDRKKVTREQFIFMLGRGDIVNCTGQLYNDQVIIRGGNGVNIGELPIFDERSGSIRRSEEVTNVKPRNGDMAQVLGQMTLTARLMNGRDNIGFEVKNHGGQVIRLPREKIIELADKKLITNAVVQNLTKEGESRKLIRGAGIDLRELPTINVDKNGKNI